MKYSLIPIKDLINKSIKLSDNPVRNKEKLEEIRNIIIKQIKTVNTYDISKIKNKMSDIDLPEKERLKYCDVLNEIKNYSYEKEKISLIVERKYTKLSQFNTRNTKKAKLAGIITAGALVIGAGTFATVKLINNKKDNKTEIVTEANKETNPNKQEINEIERLTTEYITEQKTTEASTQTYIEPTTEKIVTEYNTEKEEITTEASTQNITTEKQTEQKTTEKTTEQSKVSEAEQRTVVDLFKTMKDEAVDLYNSEGATKVRKKIKGFVVNTIDFVFFNSSINGITFDDLKEDFKEEIYDYLKTMDKVIMHFDPDYKEQLGDKYNAVKDFSKEKLGKAKELIIEKIGQERYDSIIQKKNEILDSIKENFKKYGGKALKFLKDKYLEWKEE